MTKPLRPDQIEAHRRKAREQQTCPRYDFQDVPNEAWGWLSAIFIVALVVFSLALNGCQEAATENALNDSEIITITPTVHPDKLWAAYMVYSDDTGETRLGIGPFVSEGNCRERLIAELLIITDEGGSSTFAECVPSNEMGEPLEEIILSQGRKI